MGMDLSQPAWPAFLKLLAHDVRWSILGLLARSDYRVQEMVHRLNHSQNLISYHLHVLSEHHLVTERRSSADGRDVYYSLNLDLLRTHYAAAASALHPALEMAPSIPQEPKRRQGGQPIRVLFLCTGNSARSQMAEGLLRSLSQGRIAAYSAGTQPTDVHPYAVEVLAHMGIDIQHQHSKHLEVLRDISFDYIVTVCDRVREACAMWPCEHEPMHWSFPDPVATTSVSSQDTYKLFEQIAFQLMARLRCFLILIEREHEGSL